MKWVDLMADGNDRQVLTVAQVPPHQPGWFQFIVHRVPHFVARTRRPPMHTIIIQVIAFWKQKFIPSSIHIKTRLKMWKAVSARNTVTHHLPFVCWKVAIIKEYEMIKTSRAAFNRKKKNICTAMVLSSTEPEPSHFSTGRWKRGKWQCFVLITNDLTLLITCRYSGGSGSSSAAAQTSDPANYTTSWFSLLTNE